LIKLSDRTPASWEREQIAHCGCSGLSQADVRFPTKNQKAALRRRSAIRADCAALATPELAREYFFSEGLSDKEVRRYWKKLQDESFLGFLDMIAFNLPKPQKVRTNMLVLGAEKDAVFGIDEVEATARAYNTKAEIFKGMGHDMMLEPEWRSVAERIVGWLRK
jgi:pimeloyl-ACP methyl ester carboxylesterase